MPGGIGKVSDSVVSSAFSRRSRVGRVVRNANEIYYHLDARRVYFDRDSCYLYFVDSPQDVVKKTILAAWGEACDSPCFEQLHLDTHRFFPGACRIVLKGARADTVLIALRLAGVATIFRQAVHEAT